MWYIFVSVKKKIDIVRLSNVKFFVISFVLIYIIFIRSKIVSKKDHIKKVEINNIYFFVFIKIN